MNDRAPHDTHAAEPADPIGRAIDEAGAGMSDADRRRFERLVRLGLERMASSAPPADLAEEISPALDLGESARLSWAEAFALEPVVRDLNRRALAMVKAFIRGSAPRDELRRDAEAIIAGLDEIDLDSLDDEDRRRLQRLVGEARIESRHVLSDGDGPRSLRAGRLGQRAEGARRDESETSSR